MLYSIDNGDPSVMSIDKASAQAGETVTVTNLTSSALSWKLNGVSQTDIAANGTATFTMPAGNVAVAAVVDRHLYLGSNCWAALHDFLQSGDVVEVGASLVVGTTFQSGGNVTVYYGTPENVGEVYCGPQTVGAEGTMKLTMPNSDIYAIAQP